MRIAREAPLPDAKGIAREIFLHALAAMDISAAVERHLDRSGTTIQCGGQRIDLQEFNRIEAFAFGKAAFPMAEALSSILAPEFPPHGILVTPSPPPRQLHGWRTIIARHPIPDAHSFLAGRTILQALAECNERTLAIFLISGGGSALVESSLDPDLTLEDFQQLNTALVSCGAPIEEINVIRKHLSATKGGRLAAAAPRAVKLTLAVSDVTDGQESALASGPTLPDPTTIGDAERIAAKYGLIEKFPAQVGEVFRRHRMTETPKLGDSAFERTSFELVLRPHDLRHSAHRAAEAAGYVCICDDSTDNWPVEKAAHHLLQTLGTVESMNPGHRVAVVAVGELSSPVTGEGTGGRSSAFTLCCVEKIAGKKIAVLSAGTDGIDGNSPAAGAVADGGTMDRARSRGMDPADFFRRSDAYTFFANLGDVIVTGPTGNNLRDLRILLAG
jgi:glycerate 2-kinase